MNENSKWTKTKTTDTGHIDCTSIANKLSTISTMTTTATKIALELYIIQKKKNENITL